MIRSNAIRLSAQGKPCTLNIAHVCNYNTETTVLAHLRIPGAAGTGQKPSDFLGLYACSNCHDVIDNRRKPFLSKEDWYFYTLRGLVRTHESMYADGIIKFYGDK